jgi:hypothetical protein
MGLPEALFFVLCAALLVLVVDKVRPAPLGNDSFQYLSVSANIAHGRGVETSLVHFDSERSSGRIPAPMTTFGPGYPILVAGVSFALGSPEHAARLVSILASALAPLLFWALANFAGLGRSLTRAGMALLLLNASFLYFSTAVATEPLFLLVSLSGLLLVASSIGCSTRGSTSPPILVLGQVLIAASFAVLRNRRSLIYLLSNAISGALIAVIMVRNILLAGTWKGGNEKHVQNPLRGVLVDYVKAQYHLLFGDHLTDLWSVSAAALSVLLIAWGASSLLRHRTTLSTLLASGGSLLFTYACVASAALIYLGRSSVISFGPRMFYPLLPLYILGAVLLAQRGIARSPWRMPILQTAGLVLLFLYAFVNQRDLHNPAEPSLADNVRAAFAKPMSNGVPLRQWFDATVPTGQPIAADAGQATGFVLDRPTLSLVSAGYSSIPWTQETLASQMRRFHARFLVLNLTLSPSADPVRTESGFVAQAICCRIDPGFHIAAENPDIRILELDDR